MTNKKKAEENDLLSKIDKESLVRDIITEDIQKKKAMIQKLQNSNDDQRQKINKLKEELESMGQVENAYVKQYKIYQKELEQSEKNLLIFKKNWKGKLEREQRQLEFMRKKNDNMIKESDEMAAVIHSQRLKLEEIRDQEEHFRLVREQKRVEYQSQLEMMLLEHEVLEKELAYNKMKADIELQAASKSNRKSDKKHHDSSVDMDEGGMRATMASKNVGAVGSFGLVIL